MSAARLSERGASIGTVTIFGGTEITVPHDWKVELRVSPILGGVSDETVFVASRDGGERTLVIDGVAVFGAVEVKNPNVGREAEAELSFAGVRAGVVDARDVLVAVASRHGATREIAEAIGATLRRSDLETTVIDLEDRPGTGRPYRLRRRRTGERRLYGALGEIGPGVPRRPGVGPRHPSPVALLRVDPSVTRPGPARIVPSRTTTS